MSELFPERIETDRLVLERLSTESVDALAYYGICANDPDIDEVTEYSPWDPHETPKETVEFLESRDRSWGSAASVDYLIRPKPGESGAGDVAGAAGLGVDWDRRRGDLGIWLRKRFWGRGYSGERAEALLELAFDRLDLDLVGIGVRADNEKSLSAVERYVERFGGRRDGTLRNHWTRAAEEPVDEVRFSIRENEYRRATDS